MPETCWTCANAIATHIEFRDALGENEYTCDTCHKEEYPEQYCEGGCGKAEIWDCSNRNMCKTCELHPDNNPLDSDSD